ncbi:MAG: Rab family GTPase [Promethearchaeota archaeon]
MTQPDSLVRLYLLGTIPPTAKTFLKNFPDRELSGEFYKMVGFDKPGKVVKCGGRDIQVQFLDWRNKWKLSHARVYFYNLNSRFGYKEIDRVFDLNANCSGLAKYPQTVIGLLKTPVRVTNAERMRLKNNQCIAYHEIPYGDFESLADTLSSLIDKCANSTFALLKICCTGSERKTELVRAYAEGKFSTNYLSTIGVDITTKILNLYGLIIKIIIMDTAEQEFFRKLRSSYYHGANGALIFINHEEKSRRNQVKAWHTEFRSVVPDSNVPINLVVIQAKNTTKELKDLAEELEMGYNEIRPNRGDTLSTVFENLIKKILQQWS